MTPKRIRNQTDKIIRLLRELEGDTSVSCAVTLEAFETVNADIEAVIGTLREQVRQAGDTPE